MKLDTQTLFTAIMLVELAGAIILMAFWFIWAKSRGAEATSLAYWSVGLLCAGVGTFLIALRGVLPDSVSIVVANTFIILGIGMRIAGVASFLGTNKRLLVTLAAAGCWLALCAIPPFYESFLARVNFIQGCLIAGCWWISWLAFRENHERLFSTTLLGFVALVESVGYIWFTAHQNVLDFPTYLSAFPENFMTVFLVMELIALVMIVVLPACMMIERILLGFKEQALQDPLTSLPNRRAFLQEVNSWMQAEDRDGQVYSLLLFDLDKLKEVNTEFGRSMGDVVLQLFGVVLKDILERDAVPSRWAGEEFAVFLPGRGNEHALLIAQRICRRFGQSALDASSGKLSVTACTGVVTLDGREPISKALEVADKSVLKAKKQGKAQIVLEDLRGNRKLKKTFERAAFSVFRRKAA